MLKQGGLYQYVIMQAGATGTGNGTAISPTQLDDGALSVLTMQITGISGDTITFEGSIDGTNFVAMQARNLNTQALATTATANGLYRANIAGIKSFRARVSTYGAGTIYVYGLATANGEAGHMAIAAIAAGENHVGEVAGSGKGVKVALTVSTSPAYSSGDSIGGKITIANAVRVSGGVSILNSIEILDRANQKAGGTIYIFDADPSAATITDNSAFVFSTDDLKVVAQISVSSADYTTTNSKATANLSALARTVQAASGTSLYAAFVTTSTPTYAATTDVQIVFGFVYVN